MSFIGKVTRKEVDTGVNLLAKVITPNHKKSAKKTFKVKVKQNALDDFSCCVIDHATVKNRLENSQDLSGVVADFDFTYNGIHGTTISYQLVDTTTPGISSYITEDGKLTHRPKFGDPEVSGYIEITVTKNAAIVQSRIIIKLQPLNAEEILNNPDVISDEILWNYIRGINTAQNKVYSNLTLIDKIDTEHSSVPIDITYAVNDATLGFPNPYMKPRLDVANGSIIRPSYKEACPMVNTFSTTDVMVQIVDPTADSGAMGRCIRIGGLKLTATLKLGEAVRVINFSMSTISKYLTCDEIIEAVSSQLCLFKDVYTVINYADDADNSFNQIVAPSSGGECKIQAYHGAVAESFTYDDLLLDKGKIIGVDISNVLKNYDCTGDYIIPPSLLAGGLGGGFHEQVQEGTNLAYYDELTINFAEYNKSTVTQDQKKFSIQTLIKVSGYSSNGISPQGGQLTQARKARFQISTATMS